MAVRSGSSRNTRLLSVINPYNGGQNQDETGITMMLPTENKRLYVGNLAFEVTWQKLKDHFKQAGEVIRADVMEEPGGRSKGCGIVEFSTLQEAQLAMANLNETEILGRKIFVREDREAGKSLNIMGRTPRGPPEVTPIANGCRVYVGNLSWEVKWQDLKDFCKVVGTVTRADVLEEPGGRSKGCGIVEYSNPMEAQRAINELTNQELKGRPVFVREDREAFKTTTPVHYPQQQMVSNYPMIRQPFQQPPLPPYHPPPQHYQQPYVQQTHQQHYPQQHHQQHQQQAQHFQPTVVPGGIVGRKVYIGNLSWEVKWQDLKDFCKMVGTVTRADVLEEPGGRSKGCGIVEFSSPMEAQRAIIELTDRELKGRPVFVREDREEVKHGGMM